MAIEQFHMRNAEGTREAVSREEFFARTTPRQRLFQERRQAESGGPSLYLSAEEIAADLTANYAAQNLHLPRLVERMARGWQSDYGDLEAA